jgi:cytoskeleton protein RodZ
VDLDEVHAATGIRPRYLRAIEEEDWNALPEEFYARSFVRKYAEFLGVDPDPLVAEYRRQRGTGGSPGSPTSPFAKTNSRRSEALRRRRKRQSVYVWIGTAVLAAAIVAAIVLITFGGGESGDGKSVSGGGGAKEASGGQKAKGQANSEKQAKSQTSRHFFKPKQVALVIEPTAEVWACVLDAKGKPLVDGKTLAPGETVGPFHSKTYKAAFGNGQVKIRVDQKPAKTPSTPSPMGFTVNSKGHLQPLPEGKRPSCE